MGSGGKRVGRQHATSGGFLATARLSCFIVKAYTELVTPSDCKSDVISVIVLFYSIR